MCNSNISYGLKKGEDITFTDWIGTIIGPDNVHIKFISRHHIVKRYIQSPLNVMRTIQRNHHMLSLLQGST